MPGASRGTIRLSWSRISPGEVLGPDCSSEITKKQTPLRIHVRLLQTLVSAMSVALENARLFDETQRLLRETEQRAAELAAINTVSEALVAEPELDSMIQLIGDQTRDILKADIVYVALLDRSSNLINFPYQVGDEFTPLQLGEGLTSKIIEAGQPLLINRNIDERRAQLGATLVGRQARSYLGVPIMAGKEAIGVLSVQSMTQENAFTENDVRLLSTIAANAGAATAMPACSAKPSPPTKPRAPSSPR